MQRWLARFRLVSRSAVEYDISDLRPVTSYVSFVVNRVVSSVAAEVR